MTLTGVSISYGGTKVGLGTEVAVFGLAGPVPIDDFVLFYLIPSAASDESSGYNISANAVCHGHTYCRAIMGTRERVGDASNPWTFQRHVHLGLYDLAEGTTVSLLAVQYHADFTEVDRGILTGLTWTKFVDFAQLFAALLYYETLNGGVLDDILAAVRRVYTS